jgi:hypothetical protein
MGGTYHLRRYYSTAAAAGGVGGGGRKHIAPKQINKSMPVSL